jgi:hypothetical protein
VPHGQRYLRFRGHSDHNTYNLLWRFCDTQGTETCPGQPNPTNCPWDSYTTAGTINTTVLNNYTTVSLGNDLYDGGNVCVLLQATDPSTSCTTADQVHMDLLFLTTDPNCTP